MTELLARWCRYITSDWQSLIPRLNSKYPKCDHSVLQYSTGECKNTELAMRTGFSLQCGMEQHRLDLFHISASNQILLFFLSFIKLLFFYWFIKQQQVGIITGVKFTSNCLVILKNLQCHPIYCSAGTIWRWWSSRTFVLQLEHGASYIHLFFSILIS